MSLLPDVLRRNAELARQRIFVDASGWKRADEAVPSLMPLQDAVWRDRRVRFRYDRGLDGETADRTADPLGLVAKGSVWYLVARVDGDVRTYRVSRMLSVSVLDESFERPVDFDLPGYWQQSAAQFREQLPRFQVVVRAPKSTVNWMQSMIRFGAIDGIETDEDGVCTVRMHFDAEEVATHFLVGLGPVFDLVEPESLRERIAESASLLLARLLQK
jgi:predicted DNA-binding transcriptional regulator YafY